MVGSVNTMYHMQYLTHLKWYTDHMTYKIGSVSRFLDDLIHSIKWGILLSVR